MEQRQNASTIGRVHRDGRRDEWACSSRAFTFADGNGSVATAMAMATETGTARNETATGTVTEMATATGTIKATTTTGVDHPVICHIPPGNPDNAHTITVGAPAVAAHMANHGDRSGPCETTTTTEAPQRRSADQRRPRRHVSPRRPRWPSSRPSRCRTRRPPTTICSVVIGLTGFGPSQSYDVTLVHSSPTVANGIALDLQQRSDGRCRRGPLRRLQLFPELA